jgi:hypothetical protein
MHPALWKLFRLSEKASRRALLRGARTVRGALLLAFLIGVLGSWLVTIVGMTLVMRGHAESPFQAGSAAPYLPPILMAFFLQSVLASRGVGHLYFSPAEIDFLFAGPFHRRELLLYKLFRKCLALVLVALLFSWSPIVLFFNGWLSAFVGLTLALVFVNLAGLAATLGHLIVAEAAYTRIRRMALLAVTALAVVALPQTFSRTSVFRFADLAASFRTTWPGRVLLAPFQVFSNAMLAERWFPDLIGWAGAAAAIDLALLILVLRLDADYLEWSTAISRRIYEQMQRIRRSGGVAISPSRGNLRIRMPQLPWMGGAGPIAWRQMVLTARASRAMVRVILMIAVLFLAWNWYMLGQSPRAFGTPGIGIGLVAYMTFLFIMVLPVSFRGDLDHLDFLKTLPVRPLALTLGELAGCAVVLTATQLAVLAIYGAATASGGFLLLAAAVLALPLDMLLLAASNLAFLIYPVRRTQGASSDLNVVGRGVMSFFLQLLFLLPLLGIAAGLAAVAYLASGYSLTVLVATACAVLLLELVPMMLLVAGAFERFDPSTETPA